MKKPISFLILLYLFSIVLLLNSCGNDTYCQRTSSLKREGFNIPNMYQILNYKDTFNLNDTLWFQLTIPAKFSANQKSCNLSDNQLSVYNDLVLYFLDSTYYNIYNNFPNRILIGNPIELTKQDDSTFVTKFGLVLNNPNLTHVGDSTIKGLNLTRYIYLESMDYKDCFYYDCKNPYEYGFVIHTTFQNNQAYLPIHIRQ